MRRIIDESANPSDCRQSFESQLISENYLIDVRKDMNEFTSRMLVIILGGGACIYTVMYSEITMMLFYSAVYLMCMYEYSRLVQTTIANQMAAVAITQLPLIWYLAPFKTTVMDYSLIVIGTFIMSPIGTIRALVGVLWIAPAFISSMSLSSSEGPLKVVILYTVAWLTDGFAFIMGRAIGRNKLASSISPNKTIEGTLLGILCATGITFVMSFVYDGIGRYDIFVLTLLTGVVGQIGDLFESYFKRRCGVKDTGSFLGRHGGVLDRWDSLLFAIPVAHAYIFMMPLWHP